MTVQVCNRCGSTKIEWNDADYLICMNCGSIIIEPINKSKITHGLVLWASQIKERLWRMRVWDNEN